MINTLALILKWNKHFHSWMNIWLWIPIQNLNSQEHLYPFFYKLFLFKIKSNSNKWLHVQSVCSIFKVTSWKWYINNLSQIEVNSCVKYVLIYYPQYNKFNVLLPAFIFHIHFFNVAFISFFYLKNCFITTSFIKFLMSDIYFYSFLLYI